VRLGKPGVYRLNASAGAPRPRDVRLAQQHAASALAALVPCALAAIFSIAWLGAR
jgi:cobalamin biosynthesis protein CobD/CbiB